jgi:acetyl-CoA carboxylase carboxyl transferase subunit beta
MGWFKRTRKGITTPSTEKKEAPDGLWYKTPSGKIIEREELVHNAYVSPEEGYHERIGAQEYFELIFDEGSIDYFAENLISDDPLEFTDTKPYKSRIEDTIKKTGLKDAMRCANGTVEGENFVVAAMDFGFIGGSMGSVVGEKIARAVDKAIELNAPLMIISKSGGARMMEAGFSLMQMAKTSAKLIELSNAKLPYFSYLTDPTTGGVTASFAMLGDLNIAEPAALIGFAGPRVIRETIGRDLPEGFQTSEFLLEHGFLDMIVDRRELRDTISNLIKLFKN